MYHTLTAYLQITTYYVERFSRTTPSIGEDDSNMKPRFTGWAGALPAAAAAALAGAALAVAASAAVAAGAPSNSTPPTVSGTAQQGRTLTAQSGSWSGANPILFAYQWRRCDPSGASCADVAGATDQTYTLTRADVGSTLRVVVAATNGSGSGTATSDPTATVSAEAAPVNTAPPTVAGTAQAGQTLTAANGSWSGSEPIGFTYQWRRCDVSGGGCSSIGGATAQTYALVSADVGHTLRVVVTATNGGGAASALSSSSAVVAAAGSAPASTSVPTLSGTPLQGSVLTVSQGTWSGSTPLSFSYGWQRCNASGADCATIAGATAQTYTLQRADVGNRVRGAVTAANTAGATTAYSTLSGVIGSLAPVNTALPTISGTPALGQQLTASNGSWAGTSPFQFYPQWARSNAKGGFDPIPGATSSSYVVTAADVGHKLFVQIKAANAHGVAWADSNPTATVSGPAPAPGGVLAAAITLPNRLVISGVQFAPTVITSRAPFQARFRVTDSEGRPVQGVLVYALGLPYGWVRPAAEQPTGGDGWATITFVPTRLLPLRPHRALVVFVRARKPGDSLLAGVSTRRLVQVRLR